MILSVTPNPSIDATIELSEPFAHGSVHRAQRITQQPGGKGINVSHAVHLAQAETLAVFPAHDNDVLLHLLRESGVPYENVPMAAEVRINTTVTEPGGETTKLNGPGPLLADADQTQLCNRVREHAGAASALVLAGSLPRGVDAGFYGQLIRAAREANPELHISVDTSDAPMLALASRLPADAPDLIKPNGFELGQLAGCDGQELERQAGAGDYSAVVRAAEVVVSRGIPEVLVTLGPSGAVLVTQDGAWVATPPPVSVLSTVGAGDATLAGFLLARTTGATRPEALRRSVAYGTAAAGLPGTQFPTPNDIDLPRTHVREL